MTRGPRGRTHDRYHLIGRLRQMVRGINATILTTQPKQPRGRTHGRSLPSSPLTPLSYQRIGVHRAFPRKTVHRPPPRRQQERNLALCLKVHRGVTTYEAQVRPSVKKNGMNLLSTLFPLSLSRSPRAPQPPHPSPKFNNSRKGVSNPSCLSLL